MRSSQLLALAALSTTIFAHPLGPSTNAIVAGDNTIERRHEPDEKPDIAKPLVTKNSKFASDTLPSAVLHFKLPDSPDAGEVPGAPPMAGLKGRPGNLARDDSKLFKKPNPLGDVNPPLTKFIDGDADDHLDSNVEKRHESSEMEISSPPTKPGPGKVGGHELEANPWKKPPPRGGGRFRLIRSCAPPKKKPSRMGSGKVGGHECEGDPYKPPPHKGGRR